MVTAMRVADELELELLVHWKINQAVSTDFDMLFAHDIEIIGNKTFDTLVKNPEVQLINTWRLWNTPKDRFPDDFRNSYPSSRPHSLDFEYHNIPLDIRASYLPYFEKIRPAHHIQAYYPKGLSLEF